MPNKRLKVSYGRYRGKYHIPWPKLLVALGGVMLFVDLLIVRVLTGAWFLFQFLAVASLVPIIYGALWWVSDTGLKGVRLCRILRHVMEIGFGVWLLSFVVLEAVIVSGSKTDAAPNAQYLVVLGAGLNGETPSLIYSARLEAAAAYLRENPDTLAVVTGGQGPGETISEASAGARYLEAHGVARERIVLEDASTSTSENVRFALEHIPDGAVTVMVTNEFHVFRARWIARKNGLDATGLAAPTPKAYLRHTYHLREYFSVIFMFLGRY